MNTTDHHKKVRERIQDRCDYIAMLYKHGLMDSDQVKCEQETMHEILQIVASKKLAYEIDEVV